MSLVKPMCLHVGVAGDVRLGIEGEINKLVIVCRPNPKTLSHLDKVLNTFGVPKRDECRYAHLVIDSHAIFPGLARIHVHWCLPGQFGGLFFFHTGPVGYVMRMESFWRDHGGDRFADGYLFKNGQELPAETEEEFFALLGVNPVPPEKRLLPKV